MADNENNELEEIDLEELVGKVLDSRGLTKERLDSFDGLGSKLDDLISKVSGGTSSSGQNQSSSPSFDPEAFKSGFLKEVSDLIDSKVGNATAPKPKPLAGWLGLGGTS